MVPQRGYHYMRRIPHSFCRFYKLCSVHQQKGLHSEKETHIFFIYGSCTCPMRINIAGSPVDRQRVKKSYKRGLSWPPSGPLLSRVGFLINDGTTSYKR